MGGVSSPLTDEASEPASETFFDAFLDAAFETTVFLGSFPSATRFAWRAAFEAETIFVVGVGVIREIERSTRSAQRLQVAACGTLDIKSILLDDAR